MNPDQLLAREIESVFREFVHMPTDHDYTVATLWVLHTHLRNSDGVFLPYVTPRLYFGSKQAGCGKSLATQIAVTMSHNGDIALEPTPPSITSMMNMDLSTIGMEEMDLYLGRGNGKSSMRAILNGGYKKGAMVTRVRSDEIERQNAHGPIVMNGKNLNRFLTSEAFETLRSRSIVIALERKPSGSEYTRFNPELHEGRLRTLMRAAKKWGVRNHKAILSIPVDGLMDKRIANRAEEIWTVLFRVANFLGGDWPQRCESAALAMVLGEYDSEDDPVVSPAAELLNAVAAVFDATEPFLPTDEILDRLTDSDDPPSIMGEWQTIRASQMGLANTLAVFGITHVRRTYDGEQTRGYDRDSVTGITIG